MSYEKIVLYIKRLLSLVLIERIATMQRSRFCLFLLLLSVLPTVKIVTAMESLNPQEHNALKKKNIAYIPINENLEEFDLDSEDPIDHASFTELIEEQKENNAGYILGGMETEVNGKTVRHYVHAKPLNKFLFGTAIPDLEIATRIIKKDYNALPISHVNQPVPAAQAVGQPVNQARQQLIAMLQDIGLDEAEIQETLPLNQDLLMALEAAQAPLIKKLENPLNRQEIKSLFYYYLHPGEKNFSVIVPNKEISPIELVSFFTTNYLEKPSPEAIASMKERGISPSDTRDDFLAQSRTHIGLWFLRNKDFERGKYYFELVTHSKEEAVYKAYAQYILGQLYEFGHGVSQDKNKALAYFQQAIPFFKNADQKKSGMDTLDIAEKLKKKILDLEQAESKKDEKQW